MKATMAARGGFPAREVDVVGLLQDERGDLQVVYRAVPGMFVETAHASWFTPIPEVKP